MSSLLPDRHPNKDFFVLDVRDAAPKDDMASMEHPLFSLSIKPDMRELEYTHNDKKMVIVPSGRGLATIMDKDILLYLVSKLTHEHNRGMEIGQWVEVTAHEVMVGTNWNVGKRDYKRFEDALVRLRGTTIVTNIETGKRQETEGFGLIENFKITRIDDEGSESAFGRMSKVRVKVSDFMLRAIKANEVLSIHPNYFRLRRPIERRLYEIARKHIGDKKMWQIGLVKLQNKVGSNSPLKKFRFVIRQVIADGNLPEFTMSIDNDMVTFRPATYRPVLPSIRLKADTEDRARAMAVEKGYDYQGLWHEWLGLIADRGKPDSPDGAFIGFIKKKPSLRQRTLL